MPKTFHRGLTPALIISTSAVLAVLDAQSLSSPAGAGPAPDQNVSFEAATIKPSDPASNRTLISRQRGGRFSTTNVPARMLITFAYQLQGFQLIGGPDWLSSARWDIVAKMEGDPPPVIPGTGPDQMVLALRTFLAERFKLVTHRETRELDIYALVTARPGGKPGPALKPAGDDCSPEKLAARRGAPPPAQGGPQPPVCGVQMSAGRIRFGGWPLALFASSISNQVGRQVVERTGLTGNWDFELTFAPDAGRGLPPGGADAPPASAHGPSLFTAVEEQLGLKLQPTKGPVEVMVIDSVERPTPD